MRQDQILQLLNLLSPVQLPFEYTWVGGSGAGGYIIPEDYFKKVDNVANEVSNLYVNTKGDPVYKSHEGDPTGKSKVKSMDYWFENGLISIECWNWSEEITDQKGWVDNFGVTIFSNEHLNWLNNKAYN